MGPRALSNHLRVFADYLVYEFSSSAGGTHVNRVSLFQYNVAVETGNAFTVFLIRSKIICSISCANNRNYILSIFMKKAK